MRLFAFFEQASLIFRGNVVLQMGRIGRSIARDSSRMLWSSVKHVRPNAQIGAPFET